MTRERIAMSLILVRGLAIVPRCRTRRCVRRSWPLHSQTMVVSLAIEKFTISEFEIRRLTEFLKEARPHIFKLSGRSTRSFRDHSRVLARVSSFSKQINFELPVHILSNISDKYILDKYKIEREIKESTFSHTYVVK